MRTPEDRLVYWINERYQMLLRKREGATSFTNDPILAKYRFCNVHRENDKVTRWIAEHWRNPNAEHPNLVPAMVLARMFNLPSTLENIGFPDTWDVPQMRHIAKIYRDHGYKCFNGAYLITTCGVKMDKIDYVFRVADDTRKRFDTLIGHNLTNDLENWHRWLTQVKGLGDFLAAQVIADLKNTPEHPLEQAPDWWTWCAPGPGSMRGLRRVLGSTGVTRGSFKGAATYLHASIRGRLMVPAFCMQDFQNCLCEFDKWERTYLGESKPKQLYRSKQ